MQPFVLHQWESWSSSASSGACYLVARSSLQTGKPRLIPDPHPDFLNPHLILFRLKPISISGRNWSIVSKPSLQNWTNLFKDKLSFKIQFLSALSAFFKTDETNSFQILSILETFWVVWWKYLHRSNYLECLITTWTLWIIPQNYMYLQITTDVPVKNSPKQECTTCGTRDKSTKPYR